jgi:hypothetical protein
MYDYTYTLACDVHIDIDTQINKIDVLHLAYQKGLLKLVGVLWGISITQMVMLPINLSTPSDS